MLTAAGETLQPQQLCDNQRSDRPSGSRDPRPFHEACYSSFLGRNQNFLNFPINAVTRGQNVRYRHEECILWNTPVSEIQDVCQIPMERPSIRVLLLFLRDFSSSYGIYKVIKSLYLSLERAQCKNNNYLDSMLLIASSLEDLLMARDTLMFILQHLGFLINMKKSYLQPKSISSSSNTPPLSSSSVSKDSEVNLSQLFWGESDNFGGGKKKTVMVERKLDSLQRKIFNFSPTSNKNKLRCLITRLGSELSHKCLGGQGSQISYNVLHIKGKGCNISSNPHGQHDSLVIHNKNGGYRKTKRKPEETGFSLADITN